MRKQIISDPKERFKNRTDIYWSGLWGLPGEEASVRWISAEYAKVRVDQSIMREYAFMHWITYDEAVEKITNNPKYQRHILSMLGAVKMWRNISADQLADMIERPSLGADPDLVTTLQKIPAILWNANLIQIGRHSNMAPHRNAWLYRSALGEPDAKLLQGLTFINKLGAFGPTSGQVHGSIVRHNLLNTELSLRIAEHHSDAFPIVLGEGMSTAKQLMPQMLRVNTSIGDSIWVRGDGLRVIVEVSNDYKSSIGKIKQWADVIAQDAVGAKSLALLIVVPGMRRGGRWRDEMGKIIRETAGDWLRANGYGVEYFASRIFIIGWEDWFPAEYETSQWWQSMTVRSVFRDGQTVALTSPGAIPCNVAPDKADTAIRNAKLMYGVPLLQRRDADIEAFPYRMLADKFFAERAERIKLRIRTKYPELVNNG